MPKTSAELIAEALDRQLTNKNKEAARAKSQELATIKAIDKFRKAEMNKRERFWWLGLFKDKAALANDLAVTKASLNEYATHCAKQAGELKNLLLWALEHDDGSLEEIKAVHKDNIALLKKGGMN